jgi:hypothetical protein
MSSSNDYSGVILKMDEGKLDEGGRDRRWRSDFHAVCLITKAGAFVLVTNRSRAFEMTSSRHHTEVAKSPLYHTTVVNMRTEGVLVR